MRPARIWQRWTLVAVVAAVALLLSETPRHVRAAAFVARAAGTEGWVGALAARHAAGPFRVTHVAIPTRHGPLRGRVYRPEAMRQTLVIPPGLHGMGIDEPRMVAFARDLAASGVAVITPELPDLAE